MSQHVISELTHHQYLRNQLEQNFPDIDEATLADTLEGLTNLNEMLGAVVRSHLDDMAMVEALKSRVADMQDRLSRISKRADKKREIVTSVMEQADLKKLAEVTTVPTFGAGSVITVCGFILFSAFGGVTDLNLAK